MVTAPLILLFRKSVSPAVLAGSCPPRHQLANVPAGTSARQDGRMSEREREREDEKKRAVLICGGGWTNIDSSIVMKYKMRKARETI